MNPAHNRTSFSFRVLLAALALTAPAWAGNPDYGDLERTSNQPSGKLTSSDQAPVATTGKPKKYDRVDGGNQDGTSAARDHLAEVIGTSRVGYDRETLARASTRDLTVLNSWFDQVQHVAPDFIKNAQHTREKMKGDLASQTNYSLYQARTKGWGDHQKDDDDLKVVASFLRYANDQNPPSPILNNIRDHVRDLTVAAGPAYKVTLTPEEASDPDKLAQKFERDLDRGALQFAATYLQGLMLDRPAFEAAVKVSQLSDNAIGELNRASFSSDMDLGSGRPAAAGGNGPAMPGLDQARGAASAADAKVAGLERQLQNDARGLGGNGKWTREALLDSFIKNKDVDAGRLAKTAADLVAARTEAQTLRGNLAKAERDAGTARENGDALAKRYAAAAQALGQKPSTVELSGPFAQHRANLEKMLASVKPETLSQQIYAARGNPEAQAKIVNLAARVERAVQYQLAGEESLGKLATQKAALKKAVDGVQLSKNAPADLTAELAKIKTDLDAETPAAWEKSFYEQRNAALLRTKADELSKQLGAYGDRISSVTQKGSDAANREKTRKAVNDANAKKFQDALNSSQTTEVTLAEQLEGKVKAFVTSGVRVLDRSGKQVSGLSNGATATIVGALLQGANASSPVYAYRISIPESARLFKKIAEGYVPTNYFGPVDADEFSAALAAAQPTAPASTASTGATTATTAGAGPTAGMTDQERSYLSGKVSFWGYFQMATADLEANKLNYVMELIDNTWPRNNACTFKVGVLQRFRKHLEQMDAAHPGAVDPKAYEQLVRMENTKELGSTGIEADAVKYGKEQMRALEAILKGRKDSSPPDNYRWGMQISMIGPR